ncbi:hypothetical protein HX088_00320 [Empedobacter sp. 225-1]|uniref:hypothetical protein n=1 Tax=Empedobacter sp. 225-1 TaxID=2746725 RepID=UPI002576A025|nr:hypothetical protein [Empedobacter sp. 225-1]MDM1521726.1 hypothetical protein [Empedobacter sp. 225-1]
MRLVSRHFYFKVMDNASEEQLKINFQKIANTEYKVDNISVKPDYESSKLFAFKMDIETHKRLMRHKAETGISIRDFINAAILQKLKKDEY